MQPFLRMARWFRAVSDQELGGLVGELDPEEL
jgi:hypothetical protein